ncbi:MAG: lipoyl synthase, partial [Rhodanobacter sp. SCN 68-63]
MSESPATPKTIPIRTVAAPAAEKQLGNDKIALNRAGFDTAVPTLRKPSWIRVRLPQGNAVQELKARLRENALVTVCEEASCPNIHECFSKGTATFCDVAHGRPAAPDPLEPARLAETIRDMRLKYVVITSVDRDDLRDGGAEHFASCIHATRHAAPGIKIEILTPDFRGKGRMERALEVLKDFPPDVFNHNLETVPHLYREVRPGADYQWSLDLLKRFKAQHPDVPTKSGIMLG